MELELVLVGSSLAVVDRYLGPKCNQMLQGLLLARAPAFRTTQPEAWILQQIGNSSGCDVSTDDARVGSGFSSFAANILVDFEQLTCGISLHQ